MEQRRDGDLDLPIRGLMTTAFTAIHSRANLSDATAIMAHRKISELPVVDEDDHPLGLIDVTDVLGLRHDTSENVSPNNRDEWPDAPITLRLFGESEPNNENHS
jgi:arabinose-5-phosphate isomerase